MFFCLNFIGWLGLFFVVLIILLFVLLFLGILYLKLDGVDVFVDVFVW